VTSSDVTKTCRMVCPIVLAVVLRPSLSGLEQRPRQPRSIPAPFRRQSGQQRDHQDEQQHPRIRLNPAQPRQLLRLHGQKHAPCPTAPTASRSHRRGPTTVCSQSAFSGSAGRAQRRSDHQFLTLRNRAHHQQTRKIRARNQQHEAYSPEEQQQCRPHVSYEPFLQRN
jgi:hypothetical protein